MTWGEVGALTASGMDAALLPVGATEQHGPHLTTSVDSITAERLAHAVSAETGIPVLPTLHYGCSLGHSQRWPGTISLHPQTLIEVIVQIGEWAYASAVRRLIIINGHVTNHAPLRCAVEILRSRFDDLMLAIRNVGDVTINIASIFSSDAADWHANRAETSLMLELEPGHVRLEKLAIADDPDRTGGLFFVHPVNHTSLNGVTGLPSQASEREGRELFAEMVSALSSQLRAALKEQPPLAHSYFAPV